MSQTTSGVPARLLSARGPILTRRGGQDYLIDIAFAVGLISAAMLSAVGVGAFLVLSADLRAEGAPGWVSAAPPLLGGFALVAGSRWLVLFVLSYRCHGRLSRTRCELKHFPFVAILVPAYNEQENIEAAIQSLLTLDYPGYELLIVDDGSSDATLRLARQYAGDHGSCRLRVFHKRNGGKWSALNYGFHRSRAELMLCVDADSRLSRNVLRVMVAHMADPRVAAVAGQVRVRNRHNLLTRLQGMEYLLANGASRMAQADSGTVLVVPGPLGLFRRTALEEVQLRLGGTDCDREGDVAGPFQPDTFAEDFDLSLSVLSLGGRVVYEPCAVSHTRAPDNPMALMNQRYRWCRGILQVLRKYFRYGRKLPLAFNRRIFLWVAGTYLLDLVLMPVLFISSMFSLLFLLSQVDNPLVLVGFLAMFQLVNLFAGIMFVCMHRDSFLTLICLPVYDLYQGFFVNSAWVISIFDEVRGSGMRWA